MKLLIYHQKVLAGAVRNNQRFPEKENAVREGSE